jgi:hypothetical protein
MAFGKEWIGMTRKEIAKEYGVSVTDIDYHFEHCMPQHLVFEGEVQLGTVTAAGETFSEWIDSPTPEQLIPLVKVLESAKETGYIICHTPEEIEAGKKHAAEVCIRLNHEGKLDEWKKMVAQVEANWPGFTVIQPPVIGRCYNSALPESVFAKQTVISESEKV